MTSLDFVRGGLESFDYCKEGAGLVVGKKDIDRMPQSPFRLKTSVSSCLIVQRSYTSLGGHLKDEQSVVHG